MVDAHVLPRDEACRQWQEENGVPFLNPNHALDEIYRNRGGGKACLRITCPPDRTEEVWQRNVREFILVRRWLEWEKKNKVVLFTSEKKKREHGFTPRNINKTELLTPKELLEEVFLTLGAGAIDGVTCPPDREEEGWRDQKFQFLISRGYPKN